LSAATRGQLQTFSGAALIELSGGVVVSAWGAGSPRARWDWWLARLTEAIAQNPSGIHVLSAIHMVPGEQDPAVRKSAKQELIRLAPCLASFVIYPMNEGPFAGLARSVVRTMFMMSPVTRQFRLVGSESEALDALLLTKGATRRELAQALSQVIAASA
jgi:hypothetical protein